MTINVNQDPPANIPRVRWRYTAASLFFLGFAIGAVIIGAYSVFSESARTDFYENAAFILFIVSGGAFVYCAEKIMELRKPGPKRQKKLLEMMYEHEEVSEYCRKVAEQGRYLVVMEYDAILAHVEKIEGEQPANKDLE